MASVKPFRESLSRFTVPLLPKPHILTLEAIEILSEKLRTPLQIHQHLTLAMEFAYLTGEKPVTGAIVESVLSKQIDELEPRLMRHGYDVRSLAEQFNAKPAEI